MQGIIGWEVRRKRAHNSTSLHKRNLLSYEKNPENTTGIPHGKDPNIGDNNNNAIEIGFVPVQLHVKTYPLRDEPALAYVPKGKIQPDAFV